MHKENDKMTTPKQLWLSLAFCRFTRWPWLA